MERRIFLERIVVNFLILILFIFVFGDFTIYVNTCALRVDMEGVTSNLTPQVLVVVYTMQRALVRVAHVEQRQISLLINVDSDYVFKTWDKENQRNNDDDNSDGNYSPVSSYEYF